MARRPDLPILAALARQAEQGDRDAKRQLKTISEYDFQVAVCRYAENNNWIVGYTRRSGHTGEDGKWRGSGPKGEPDLRLVRYNATLEQRDLLFAEIKRETGYPTPDQKRWLDTLGEYGKLWRPRDAHRILEELS